MGIYLSPFNGGQAFYDGQMETVVAPLLETWHLKIWDQYVMAEITNIFSHISLDNHNHNFISVLFLILEYLAQQKEFLRIFYNRYV